MAFELQVANDADPRPHLILHLLHSEDENWLTVCHDSVLVGCLPRPIRYESKQEAQSMLDRLYPLLLPAQKRIVPARSLLE